MIVQPLLHAAPHTIGIGRQDNELPRFPSAHCMLSPPADMAIIPCLLESREEELVQPGHS